MGVAVRDACEKRCLINVRSLNVAKKRSGMGRKVVWIVKTSFSVGVAGGKELTSDNEVREGIIRIFLRGVAYVPAMRGWERRASLPYRPGLMVEGEEVYVA